MAAAAVKTSSRPHNKDDDDIDTGEDHDANTTTTTPLSSTPPPPAAAASPPLLSILNVVVDHVMMSPSPLEPKEFSFLEEEARNGRLQQQQQQQQQQQHEPSSFGGGPVQPLTSSILSMVTKNCCIRVPILRVFGPVLKDGDCGHYNIDNNDCSSSSAAGSNQKQHNFRQPQSGCLHIHGAYPYMLARPVVAGPDGSMYPPHHPGHNNCNHHHGRIDWDDAYSVVTILEEIQFRLEMALRASYEHHHGNNSKTTTTNNNNNSNNIGGGGNVGGSEAAEAASFASAATAKNSRGNGNTDNASKSGTNDQSQMPLFVRRVTIVIGRGFYTYCPGPAAPFLRVEYYDPSMRWRVKMILERGLELNELYHPDPARYDYVEMGVGGGGGGLGAEFTGDIRPLKFRCYEAHIPYTMQVFKDYNLAGMKYVKVGSARFRNPLPRSLRKRTREEFTSTMNKDGHLNDIDTKNDAYFFAHAIPKELVWPLLDDTNRESGATLDEHWLKKQSSCDLEFDCTVQQLLDVLDVMTELPQNLDERQKVYWRAVPSLREIWEQERKRMSLLLPPENDFLSGLSKEEEIVYSDEEKSSESSIECEDDDDDDDVIQRMNDHVSDTPEFTLNVKKGASIPGTRQAVKGIKQLFRTSAGLETDFRRALRDIVLRHEQFINDVDGGINRDGVFANSASTDACEFTLDCDEGIEALAALGDQFSQNGAAIEEDPDRCSQINIDPETVSKGHTASNLFTQRNYDAVPLSQKDAEDEIEMLSFGHRVDSGDVLSSLFIPCDDTTELDDEDDDFLVEEEQLGEKGFELALTQLATQSIEPTHESPLLFDSYNEESHVDMDHNHSHLSDKFDDNDLFSDDDGDNSLQMKQVTNDRILFLSQPSEDSATIEHATFEDSIPASTFSMTQASEDGFSQSHLLELPTSRFDAGPRKSCDLRCGAIVNISTVTSKPWHTLPSLDSESCPPWFLYRWTSPGAPPLIPSSHMEPVKRPPSYSQVKSWVRVHRKRTELSQKCQSYKQEKLCVSKTERCPPCLTAYTQYSQFEEAKSEETPDPLAGLGHQGGRVQVSAGGGMKTQINTATTFTPLTIMSVEVHVQCRISTVSKDQNEIAMVPDSSRDAVFAVAYVFGSDRGGGESLEILEKGCVLVTTDLKCHSSSVINGMMGLSSDVTVERVNSERSLLLRIASIVKQKDPDALVSWDTQGGGIGFLVERGVAIGRSIDGSKNATQIDMARLLGRTPRVVVHDSPSDIAKVASSSFVSEQHQNENGQLWSGSGLGGEWDDMAGAGTAASSIVSLTDIIYATSTLQRNSHLVTMQPST